MYFAVKVFDCKSFNSEWSDKSDHLWVTVLQISVFVSDKLLKWKWYLIIKTSNIRRLGSSRWVIRTICPSILIFIACLLSVEQIDGVGKLSIRRNKYYCKQFIKWKGFWLDGSRMRRRNEGNIHYYINELLNVILYRMLRLFPIISFGCWNYNMVVFSWDVIYPVATM